MSNYYHQQARTICEEFCEYVLDQHPDIPNLTQWWYVEMMAFDLSVISKLKTEIKNILGYVPEEII